MKTNMNSRKIMHEALSLVLFCMLAAGLCAVSLYLYWTWPRTWGFFAGILAVFALADIRSRAKKK